ncbi:hypothetical protein [Streptomyces brevispora]|uniref:Uncharacterized protein n=1 Tax=Streptomyces brevispora TaxID=887462 RepID=A0ABZ1GDW7_9ACTN|nr:hypothetical protein [Streptomyces brevispora]WSC18133.1 hypothetical protein OIE64_00010 [Streptomyces brevispora]WSC18157.1 hypothetical protein OIE64_36030 [Streptomyces brevispora]
METSAAAATLVSTADSAYRQRGRALTTSAVMKLGEIIHNRLQAAEQAGPVDTTNSREGGRNNVLDPAQETPGRPEVEYP